MKRHTKAESLESLRHPGSLGGDAVRVSRRSKQPLNGYLALRTPEVSGSRAAAHVRAHASGGHCSLEGSRR
jgi:hypothetical protein